MSNEKFLKLIGEQIRKTREELHVTQSELARRTDKDRQNIYQIEKGKINVTVFSLKQIAEALNVPVKKFFDF